MPKSTSHQKPKIIAIVGPTASGKSDLAVEVARYIKKNRHMLGVEGAEIISADSRQVYKGLNLSSGKITKKEMGGIPHFMLDVVSPTRTYTVAQYQKQAKKILRDILKRNTVPIICGGTGFYIDSLLYETTFPLVRPHLALRKKLEMYSTEKLFSLLMHKDPRRASEIDSKNRRRLIRALEIIGITKRPVQPNIKTSPYQALWIGIFPPKELLADKIYKRILSRVRSGMIAEIKNIHTQGVSWKRLDDLGLEFRWIGKFLQKKITKQEMIDGLFGDIKRYAKRQMTWLRKNHSIHWIDTKQKALTLTNDFLNIH